MDVIVFDGNEIKIVNVLYGNELLVLNDDGTTSALNIKICMDTLANKQIRAAFKKEPSNDFLDEILMEHGKPIK